MYPRIACVTSGADPDLEILLAALRRARFDPTAVAWDAELPWDDFDVVLVRSLWPDMAARPAFLRWARTAEETTLVANPARLLARDRTSLRDLAGRGVPVLQTWWFEPGDDPAAFERALAGTGWKDFAVHATIRGAEVTVAGDPTAAARRAAELAAVGGAVVQPVTNPVTSVTVLAGQVSHAVCEGRRVAVPEQARDFIALVPEDALFARIDLVPQQDQWVLADLDAAAPVLSLDHEAAERLAKAVRVLLSPPAQA